MTTNATTAGQAATTHARTTRRGLLAGLGLALGATPAMAATSGSHLHDGGAFDDGATFLAWEAEHATRLEAASTALGVAPQAATDAAFRRAAETADRILSTPCSSRTAAVVKLRTLLHPEAGHFSCGEGEHDETALQQVLAVLGDGRGEWTAPASGQAFSVALAAWREAHEAYGEVTNRLDREDIYEGPEIDAADARETAAFRAMLAAPTATRAALADKLEVIAQSDRLELFIAALRRGEG